MEKRYIHKDGYIVWVMLSVSLIWNSDNMPNFHIAQIVDITAMKKLMEEQQIKNQALSLTSGKLNDEIRQLRDFNGIVTHNLRGPVSSIVNLTEMISIEDSEQEKQELLQLISSTAKTLNETLLDLMQILEVRLNNKLSHDQCSLSTVLEHTLDMFRAEIVRFKVDIVTNFCVSEVSFPKIYLESIFHNMISNSIKYHRLDVKPAIKISSARENGHVKIIFEDNGIGIDLQRYGKDMFKFSKVFHSGYDSKGVGLFITKNQIEMYGGTIEVDSEPGNGTRFIILI
jgi:signal transduction histidine kinase